MVSPFFTLLFPEKDRIAREPIGSWLDNLSSSFDESINNCNFHDLEVVTNNLSLVCFYLGHKDISRNMCINAHHFFYKTYVVKKIPCPNKFGILQPYINLIRLCRFLKQWDEAENTLSFMRKYDTHIQVGGYKLDHSDFSSDAIGLLQSCRLDEWIKMALYQKSYTTIVRFLKKGISPPTKNHVLYFLELKIISYVAMGQKEHAPVFMESIINELKGEEAMRFHLKLVHFYILIEDSSKARTILKTILDVYKEPNTKTPLYELRLWLNLARTCKELKKNKFVKSICNTILPLFEDKNDELSALAVARLIKETGYENEYTQEILQKNSYAYLQNFSKHGENLGNRVIDYLSNTNH